MRKTVLPLILATMLVPALHAAPAQAQARVFVGAQGSDANNTCTNFALPCRTFQRAHDTVGANGEIDVIDPAGYGVLTITKAISIQGHGFASIGAPSGAGITILAGLTDKINLRGLLVDGVHTGTNGLVFTAGASLTLQDCVFRNFTLDGIDFNPGASSELSASNTVLADNRRDGILIKPTGSGITVTGVFDNVESNNNQSSGLDIDGSASTGTIAFTISNSVIAANSGDGILAQSALSRAATSVMVRASNVVNNGSAALVAASSAATLRVTRSAITGNGTGFFAGSGTLSSYGDNNVDGNATNGTPTNTILLH